MPTADRKDLRSDEAGVVILWAGKALLWAKKDKTLSDGGNDTYVARVINKDRLTRLRRADYSISTLPPYRIRRLRVVALLTFAS